MRRLLGGLGAVGVVAALGFFAATMPRALPAEALEGLPRGDAARGGTYFWAGGCASCHAVAKAEGPERLKLGGGQVLATGFGNFVVPNISMHPQHGIGAWTLADFANAMLRGVSPEGQHYYPAFPYTSFTRMDGGDVADLWAFFQTLPAVAGETAPHDLRFPFGFRRGLGLWKLAFLGEAPAALPGEVEGPVARGQYLTEGAGHCGECHTPRNLAGGIRYSRWLAGAPALEGEGRVPNITPGEGGIGGWSESDIAYYFETGFTPDFDTVSGSMVAVQENLAMLDPSDRAAIAAYLKAVPAQDTPQ